MTCSECKTYLDHWLQEQLELPTSANKALPIASVVLEHVYNCHECAIHMEMIQMILGTSPHMGVQVSTIPKGLQNRVSKAVMKEIHRDETKNRKFVKQVPRLYKYLLAAAVLAMVFLPLIDRKDSGFVPMNNPGAELAQVRLEIEVPQAESVVVVGDWNNWNPQSHYLAKGSQGETWSIEMELEQGKEYRYQFVIDGERWIPDPNAYLQVDDGFGGINSILEM